MIRTLLRWSLYEKSALQTRTGASRGALVLSREKYHAKIQIAVRNERGLIYFRGT